MTDATPGKNALIIGASRGLGLALAAEYVTRGDKHAGEGGLHFLDYQDRTVPW